MAEQKYTIRIGKKNNAFNAFLFRSKERMDEIADMLDAGLKRAFAGDDPYVTFTDDFGYRTTQDMREVGAINAVGLYDSNLVQNELNLAAHKGVMHLNHLVDADPELKAFIRMSQGNGAILRPGTPIQ